MNSLEYIIDKDILTEDRNFHRSYDTAMHLFNNFDPKTNKNPNMLAITNDSVLTKLNSRGELSCIFCHRMHQPQWILQDITTDSHYIVVYHHNDMDGYVSAATVKAALMNPPQKFIEYNFNDFNPIIDTTLEALAHKHENQKTIAIIVDLSLPWEPGRPGLMEFILNTFDQVIWVDHHSTSLAVAQRLTTHDDLSKLSMFIDTRMSSAMQCACLFKYPSTTSVHQIVSYYDRKDDRRAPLFYQLGVFLNQYIHDFNANDPDSAFYSQILTTPQSLSQVLSTGETLCSIKTLKDKVMYDADVKYKCEYFGLTIIGLNRSGNSQTFVESMPLNTVKVLFRKLPDGNWLFSTYTDSPMVKKMNLGIFMREVFGGGGHPGAAGANFSLETLYRLSKDNGLKDWNTQDSAVTMIGPDPRLNEGLRRIFSDFCSLLVNRWVQFKEAEEKARSSK